MKYLLIFITSIVLFACNSDQSQSETVNENAASDTIATRQESIAKARPIDDRSIEEKMQEVAQLKSKLIALENVPIEAKADIEAAINLMENMEGQVAAWEESMQEFELTQADKTAPDTSALRIAYNQAVEREKFLSKQLGQVIRMSKRQLARVK
ncbi:MAG: hypothetical protein AAF849_06275 [Bacteroidota bacterium]